MALQRLISTRLGVPQVADVTVAVTEYGFVVHDDHSCSTVDGGHPLRLVHSPRHLPLGEGVAADDPDEPKRELAKVELPGELTFTGTPGGAGRAREQARYLSAGTTTVSVMEGTAEPRHPVVVGRFNARSVAA